MARYNGLLMGCAPGTHEAAFEMMLRHVKARSGVLDLGARSGAMLARFRDHGFTDLHGIDLAIDKFKLDGVVMHKYDLNTDFSRHFDRKFSLITASEVIEHLDSPRHFLSEIHNLLGDDGYVLITLPNIAFWAGRVKFALSGEHWGFGESHWRHERHISPMTYDQMKCTMRETGFELVDSTTAGSFAGPLKVLVFAPATIAFRLIGGPRALGECSIYLAKKVPLNQDVRQPEYYRRSWESEPPVRTSADT